MGPSNSFESADRPASVRGRSARGFTLVVILSSLLVAVATYTVLVGCGPSWHLREMKEVDSLNSTTFIVAGDGSFEIKAGQTINPPFHSDCMREPTSADFAMAEAGGARRVRVTVPSQHEPLFGILALCSVYKEFNGALSHSYRIEVPDEYVQATDGGRVSVVYEKYDMPGGGWLPGWVLWLSRERFPKSSAETPTSVNKSVSQWFGN
jgi:hypothetical protein